MTSLSKIICRDLAVLKENFVTASIEGKGTPQEVADRSENSVRKLLKKYLLGSNSVTKGIIRDSFGKQSKQIDAVILSPYHPDLLRDEYMSFIMADEVTCAIEIKKTLNKKSLEEALNQIASVKNLQKRKSDSINFESMTFNFDIWKSTVRKIIPAGIFCLEVHSEDRIIENIFNYYRANNIPTCEWVDFIVSLDGLLVTTSGFGHSLRPFDKLFDGKNISQTMLTIGRFEDKILEYFLSVILYICNDIRNEFTKEYSLNYYIDNFSVESFTTEKLLDNTYVFFDKKLPKEKIVEFPTDYRKLSGCYPFNTTN